jgi:GNAT superfamily N-acetyltransferase
MVRRATTDDFDRVATVWHQSASLMDGAASPMPSRQQLRDRIDRELAAGWELFLAERGGHIMGMLALRPADAILDQIFVLPDQEASGIGTALMAMAKRRMPEGFSLRMAAANERAARFYERSGLVLSGNGIHPSSGVPVCYYSWKPCR